jgi:tellurite resistance protein TerC
MVWLNDLFGGKFPISWSLGVIAALLAGSIAASWVWPARRRRDSDASQDDAAA